MKIRGEGGKLKLATEERSMLKYAKEGAMRQASKRPLRPYDSGYDITSNIRVVAYERRHNKTGNSGAY